MRRAVLQASLTLLIASQLHACRGAEERPARLGGSLSPVAATPSKVFPSFGPETLRRKITAADGRSWDAGFDVACDGAAFLVTLRVKLVPGPDVTRAAIRERQDGWSEAAARAWSRRVWAEAPDGQRLPVLFALSFAGAKAHHDVIVRPGAGRSRPLHWNLYDPPQRVAHEIGHLLGAYDEYPGGALAPSRAQAAGLEARPSPPPRPSAGASLMGVEGRSPQGAEPRHWHALETWLRQRSGVALRLVKAAS